MKEGEGDSREGRRTISRTGEKELTFFFSKKADEDKGGRKTPAEEISGKKTLVEDMLERRR